MSLIPSSAKSRFALAGGVAVTGLALTTAGVYASLQAQASNTTAESVTSGVLSLTLAPSTGSVGFNSAISGMAPGDTVNRYVDLTNSGGIPAAGLTLGAVDSPASPLSTDATNGLQVKVTSCSGTWTIATGTCVGTATQLASTSLSALTLSPAQLLGSAVAVPALQHLQISLTLPPSNEVTVNGTKPANSIQGATSALTWTFTETQDTTANSTTNS